MGNETGNESQRWFVAVRSLSCMQEVKTFTSLNISRNFFKIGRKVFWKHFKKSKSWFSSRLTCNSIHKIRKLHVPYNHEEHSRDEISEI